MPSGIAKQHEAVQVFSLHPFKGTESEKTMEEIELMARAYLKDHEW